MKRQFIAFIFLVSLCACIHNEKKTIAINRNFKIPVVVQVPTKDSIELSKSDFLNEVYFRFFGKYKFTDTLHLNAHRKRDTTYRKDIIWEHSCPEKNDSLGTDGFQIFIDYKTTIYNRNEILERGTYYFPVYVVNETSRTKIFFGKDGYVFGLQEAIDTDDLDTWRPIECGGFDFCGNGYFGLKIYPGEFAMFLVPKYLGNEKGLMRIRLQIGESIYISQSFTGIFNRNQFSIKKHSWAYDGLKENKASAIQGLFYGAKPKGYDDQKHYYDFLLSTDNKEKTTKQ